MSKIKLLLNVAEDMRSLADSINELCDSLAENEPTAPLTAEVREIIAKCGGTKLSEIPKEQYANLLKLAEVL